MKNKIIFVVFALFSQLTLAQNSVYNNPPLTLLPGYTSELQGDSHGYLMVNVAAGSVGSSSSGNAAASTTAATVPLNAGYTGFNLAGNLVGVSSANPLPTANNQVGTWTMQPGNIANTVAWKVDGSSVTQPVSIASMPSTPVTGTFWQSTQPVSFGAIPAGTNNIGTVAISGTIPVSGSFFQATQPVSIAGTLPVAGTFWQTTQPVSIASSVPVTGTFYQTTQPVSLASPVTLAAGSAAIGTVSVTALPAIPTGTNTIGAVNINGTVPVSISGGISTFPAPYPSGAAPLSASSGNVANSAAAATLGAATGKSTYVSGFEMTGSGATLGSVVVCTLTGTTGGTLSYIFASPTGLLAIGTPLNIHFEPALQSSAVNTSIVANCPALGLGNTNAAMTIHGYQF